MRYKILSNVCKVCLQKSAVARFELGRALSSSVCGSVLPRCLSVLPNSFLGLALEVSSGMVVVVMLLSSVHGVPAKASRWRHIACSDSSDLG